MSGGQQRMLSLGLLLMAGPRLLMLDEPSLGLAPAVVQQIFDRVRQLANEERLAVLLLEQNVGQALRVTDRAYVMRAGRVILEETGDQLREREQLLGPLLMPRMSEAEVTAFLDEPGHLVRIGTVDDDGWVRVVPTWFVRRDRDILFTPRSPAVFLANLRRDDRVALSIDEEPLPYRKVTIQGRARIVHEPGDDDVWRDTYRAIACRYVPTEQAEAYIQNTIDQPRALVAVDLDAARVTTWRMPVEDEAPTGIWARRYYGDGTAFARLADSLRT